MKGFLPLSLRSPTQCLNRLSYLSSPRKGGDVKRLRSESEEPRSMLPMSPALHIPLGYCDLPGGQMAGLCARCNGVNSCYVYRGAVNPILEHCGSYVHNLHLCMRIVPGNAGVTHIGVCVGVGGQWGWSTCRWPGLRSVGAGCIVSTAPVHGTVLDGTAARHPG